LLAEIEANQDLQGTLKQEGAALVSEDTRIVVLNKTRTPDSADREEVPEEALPARLVAEFAHLSRGLLASFALSSVAAVRRGAHHVLSLYASEVDGAFVAHRCEIPHPDDSKAFALDLISSELRNLIEIDDVAETTLGAPIVEAWLDRKIQGGHKFQSDYAEIPSDEVKKLIDGGVESLKQSKAAQHVPGDKDKKADKKIKAGALARVFYQSAGEAEHSVRRLSRLSTFQRETTRTRLPPEWRPKLTLGSVIQRIEQEGDGDLLLCVQPRCDSIRLTGRTAFPFQTIAIETPGFNLVVPSPNGEDKEVWVNLKPRDAKMIEFDPDEQRRAVFASRNDETTAFVFVDALQARYVWVGDLKAMKAQLWATELGARVQAVGMEEFEWLRLASDREIKRDWAK
jgi:hypothetical protein